MKQTFVVLAVSGLMVAGCASSGDGKADKPSYKTVTCGQFTRLASADDAATNGALALATAYVNSTAQIAPARSIISVAAFGDQIVASCGTATPDTKILALKPRIVAVFLAKRPEDSA